MSFFTLIDMFDFDVSDDDNKSIMLNVSALIHFFTYSSAHSHSLTHIDDSGDGAVDIES